jgi:hypothetical protein
MRALVGFVVLCSIGACTLRSLDIGDSPASTSRDLGGVETAPDFAAPDLAISCAQAEADFNARIKPLIVNDCLVCHSTLGSSPPNLFGGSDLFDAVTSDPRLIGPTPDTCGLVHPPESVWPDQATQDVVRNWVAEYDAACL